MFILVTVVYRVTQYTVISVIQYSNINATILVTNFLNSPKPDPCYVLIVYLILLGTSKW